MATVFKHLIYFFYFAFILFMYSHLIFKIIIKQQQEESDWMKCAYTTPNTQTHTEFSSRCTKPAEPLKVQL